jgi:hypothetical protein
MFLQDTRIIQRYCGLDVLAQRFEIMFKDGTAVALHPVHAVGTPQMFLRAVHHEGLQWVVFDLRHLAAEMEADVLRLHSRDTPGVVFYTLRRHFPTASDFLAKALAQRVAAWWQYELEAA